MIYNLSVFLEWLCYAVVRRDTILSLAMICNEDEWAEHSNAELMR